MLLIVTLLRILILCFSPTNNQQKIGEFYLFLSIVFIHFNKIVFYKNYFYLLIVVFSMYLISTQPHKLISFDICIVYK